VKNNWRDENDCKPKEIGSIHHRQLQSQNYTVYHRIYHLLCTIITDLQLYILDYTYKYYQW